MTDHQTCAEAASRVYEYLDGELTWLKRVKIKWHLRSCSGCESAFLFEEGFIEKVRGALGEECPDEVIDRLRGFLHDHEQA